MSLTGRSLARVKKEIEKFESSSAVGLKVVQDDVWHITITGAEGTVYSGEQYVLQVRFNNDYPMDSPEVVFLTPAPMHPHIYSNGHICLNVLYEDWSPALTVHSLCLSILSMLSSAPEKALPPDNARYTSVPRGNPKHTKFAYHDDTV